LGALGAALGAGCSAKGDPNEILNVSFDPTRELYAEYNALFAAHWAALGNPTPKVEQSHGGAGKQARAVIDGLDADVVTLALDRYRRLAGAGLVDAAGEGELPGSAARRTPRRSCSWFAAGNPKSIRRLGRPRQPGRRRDHARTPRRRAARAGTTSRRGAMG
jgi:ABC-type sulfate transport system substrate-binding protein